MELSGQCDIFVKRLYIYIIYTVKLLYFIPPGGAAQESTTNFTSRLQWNVGTFYRVSTDSTAFVRVGLFLKANF